MVLPASPERSVGSRLGVRAPDRAAARSRSDANAGRDRWGRSGSYDAVEAATGRFVFSIDLGLQNLVTAIDPETGHKTIDTRQIPGDGQVKMVCPHGAGVKNYLPAVVQRDEPRVLCAADRSLHGRVSDSRWRRAGRVVIRRELGHPSTARAAMASTDACRRSTSRRARRYGPTRDRAPQTTGVLATAGGVVFAGAFDRFIRAYDDASGKVLWQTRLHDVSSSTPVSFSVGGKQYVAVVTGQGGFHAAELRGARAGAREPARSWGGAVGVCVAVARTIECGVRGAAVRVRKTVEHRRDALRDQEDPC